MIQFKKCMAALCLGAMVTLSACASNTATSNISGGDASFDKKDLVVNSTDSLALSKESITGLWKQNDNLYYFAKDGQFVSFTNTNIAGGAWTYKDATLAIEMYDKTLQALPEERFTGVIKNDAQMLLLGDRDEKSVWERSNEKVGTLAVEFFIRERMALPPVVMVETKLNQENKTRFLSRALYKTAGSGQIPMSVYYLADRINAKSPFELSAIMYHENSFLFVTPKTVIIPQNTKKINPILLVQPDDKMVSKLLAELEEPLATLENTYWKLIKLEGKNVKVEGTEPHLILRNADGATGEGAGSDGCNNYFLSWQRAQGSAQAVNFNLGGATMKMCLNETMEQAQKFMINLDKVNKYTIQGNTLLLQENNNTRLVFEAVAL